MKTDKTEEIFQLDEELMEIDKVKEKQSFHYPLPPKRPHHQKQSAINLNPNSRARRKLQFFYTQNSHDQSLGEVLEEIYEESLNPSR